MASSHTARVGRTPTGGRYRQLRKKKHFELGRESANTTIGSQAKRSIKTKGGHRIKIKLLRTNIINLYDPKSKSFVKATIKTVANNPANRNYVRRNIITRGAIVETDKGKAKITSRPGQEGVMNGILIAQS